MKSIKLFRVSPRILKRLSLDEKKILPILIDVAKATDKIFLLQENPLSNGSNLYPRDATKSEIQEAAKKTPKIFSPFTVVKRNSKKELVAIDYHLEYKNLLIPISILLSKAARLSNNPSFKKYLTALASALKQGKYDQIDKTWLSIKDSNLDLTLGPYERYLDKLFFIKRAYQATVGIVDPERTRRAKLTRDILFATTKPNAKRVMPPKVVDMQVEQNPIMSGFVGRALFSAQHLPSDSESTEKFGSRILGFNSVIDYKFDNLVYPIFDALFEEDFKKSYSYDLLKRGNYYYVLLTAIAQQLHRYKNSRTRLKELFPVFDEANSAVSGITHAKHLVLKGVINQKELEGIMISLICWAFSERLMYSKTNIREDFLKGDALVLNFLLREGALQQKEGISWPNFAKMFFEMENLATIFVRILEQGSHEEGEGFLSRYLSLDAFDAFDSKVLTVGPL